MRLSTLMVGCSFASAAYSQNAKNCPSDGNGVCYQVNLPSTTANTGKGDIFFQITGPSSMQWIGLGEGSAMAGSNIFVAYASADGTNVTLSPRSGTGNVEPQFNSQTQLYLLGGSGISGGVMTANVRCANCESWSGGNLNVESTSSSWIWAAKQGSPLKSDSTSAKIQQHDAYGTFQVDLTKATSGPTPNPFTSNAAAGSASNVNPVSPADPSSNGSSAVSDAEPSDLSKIDMITMAHGIMMALAFVICFPLGALIIRVFSFKGSIWLHVGVQMLGYALAMVALVMGIWITIKNQEWGHAHPIIGVLVVLLLAVQPLVGFIHHRLFVKHNRRTVWSNVHVWLGRLLLISGIINGGLGLQLSGNTKSGDIAYCVAAAVMLVLYVDVMVGVALKKKRAMPPKNMF